MKVTQKQDLSQLILSLASNENGWDHADALQRVSACIHGLYHASKDIDMIQLERNKVVKMLQFIDEMCAVKCEFCGGSGHTLTVCPSYQSLNIAADYGQFGFGLALIKSLTFERHLPAINSSFKNFKWRQSTLKFKLVPQN